MKDKILSLTYNTSLCFYLVLCLKKYQFKQLYIGRCNVFSIPHCDKYVIITHRLSRVILKADNFLKLGGESSEHELTEQPAAAVRRSMIY